MNNFRFIETGIDVSKILGQIEDEDWQAVSTYSKIGGQKNPYGFLPLVMAMVRNADDNPKNSELVGSSGTSNLNTNPYFDQ